MNHRDTVWDRRMDHGATCQMGGWATGTPMMNKSLQLETGFSRSLKSVILSLFISVTSHKVIWAWSPVTWDGQIEGVGLRVRGMVPVWLFKSTEGP